MNYRQETQAMKIQFELEQANQKLTFAEKLNKRIEILSNFMIENASLRDQIRNLAEIERANANDFEAKIDLNFRHSFIRGKMQKLYKETEEKLEKLRRRRETN